MTIELTQTQFAHTINVPDEWEYNGHIFQAMQDECTECPTEWLDSTDALCVIGGPHGCILHNPADTNCPAMLEFDNFHKEHGRKPTQEEWAALCPDYWVYVGWHGVDTDRMFAAAFRKNTFPIDPCESWVHEYSLWADGYVWLVHDLTMDEYYGGIYTDSKEDAIKYYIENYM
nr:MAG TPA: hypothetical protein [Caudoviricetes sp.]